MALAASKHELWRSSQLYRRAILRALHSHRKREIRRYQATVQHGAVADRLDRGNVTIQKQEKACPIYKCRIFQPAAKRPAVGPLVVSGDYDW
jgi:hypothetical protein